MFLMTPTSDKRPQLHIVLIQRQVKNPQSPLSGGKVVTGVGSVDGGSDGAAGSVGTDSVGSVGSVGGGSNGSVGPVDSGSDGSTGPVGSGSAGSVGSVGVVPIGFHCA